MTTDLGSRRVRTHQPTTSETTHPHPLDRTASRRQVASAGAALGALLGLSAAIPRTSAQDTTPDAIAGPITTATDKLMALGFPSFDVTVGESGVTGPTEVTEGWYLVGVTGEAPYIAYFDFMRIPDGLDEETATALALDAGRNDIAQPDWVYAGGTNSFTAGEPAHFATYLTAGDYHMAASYYLPEQGSEEILKLVPLTVSAAEGTPVATPAAPATDVRLEETDDLTYIVTPDVVPLGDTLWEVVNTGQHMAHHVVMSKYPDGTTAEAIIADFETLYSGTPPAGEPLVARAIPIAYAALQSGGITTLIEMNLTEPGDGYAVVCFIMDPVTMRPHVLDGMVTVFSVG